MAKQSQVLRDLKRKKLITKYADKRAELRKRLNDPLDNHRKCSRAGNRLRVRNDLLCARVISALDLVAAHGVHRLRGQPDMRHDRDATINQKPDRL